MWRDRGKFWELDPTISPQLSTNWMLARYGRIRGGDILQILDKTYNPQTALQDPIFEYDHTAHGIVHEASARYWLEQHMTLRRAGLCVPKPTSPWVATEDLFVLLHLGGSPDDFTDTGIVEYKCPDKIYPYLRKPTHKINPQHFGQIQLNMFITGKPTTTYVVWTPTEVHMETIHRNYKYCQTIVQTVIPYIKQHILPNINKDNFWLPEDIKTWYWQQSSQWSETLH